MSSVDAAIVPNGAKDRHSPAVKRPATLSPEHWRELTEESAIDPAIVLERGYRSVRITSRPSIWDGTEFPATQRVPGLLIPSLGPDREPVQFQLKPDSPRTNGDGKPIKYETPKGTKPSPDVHPRCWPHLLDTSKPLLIVEGIKKGDSALSHGFEVVIALPGVWNHMQNGARHPFWDEVALRGRLVSIAYDSDVMVKASVRAAIDSLTALLERRGATVRYGLLPDLDGLDKTGIDDYFAHGGTYRQLVVHHFVEELPEPRDWPLPEPLIADKGPDIDADLLPPGEVRDLTNAAADSLNVSRIAVAHTALGTLAAAGVGRWLVTPGRPDRPHFADWIQPATLYGILVADPGSGKTAIFNKAQGFMQAWGVERGKAFEQAVAEWGEAEAPLRSALTKARKAAAEGKLDEEGEAHLERLEREYAEHAHRKPADLSYLIQSDSTPQQIRNGMLALEGRVAVLGDEGTPIHNMTQYSRIPEIDTFLRGDDGQPLPVRRSEVSGAVPHANLAMMVATQPDQIRRLGDVSGFDGRGMLSRFWPVFAGTIAPIPIRQRVAFDPKVQERWDALIAALLAAQERALAEPGGPSVTVFRLEPAAHERFLDLYDEIEEYAFGLRGDMRIGYRGWVKKFAGKVLRIAVALHMGRSDECVGQSPLEREFREISLDTLERAIAYGDVLHDHAKLMFAMVGDEGMGVNAVTLLDTIATKVRPGDTRVRRRDLWQWVKRKEAFKRADDFAAVLSELEARGWITLESIKSKSGPDTQVIMLHPELHDLFRERHHLGESRRAADPLEVTIPTPVVPVLRADMTHSEVMHALGVEPDVPADMNGHAPASDLERLPALFRRALEAKGGTT